MKARTMLMLSVIIFFTVTEGAIAQDKKPTACDLKTDMRKLWEDHITWTRNVILNIMDGLPGTNEAVNRLLQNQDDIGNAIKPFYGDAAGSQLSTLLRSHITIAADLLTALKTGNQANFNTANTQWVANADAIAAFLSAANPNWPLADMKTMMHDHLNLTAAEAVARKTANYAADITAYDNVHNEILSMADMLTDGIVKQFPAKFKGGCPDIHHDAHSMNNIIQMNQNVPNPFMSQTIIPYFLPETVKQAQVIVYDDMGHVVRKMDVHAKGEGQLVLDAENLKSGIYKFSLIADGKLIETRTMIH